ncbi:phosphonate metabolism transcriptional regulator PhnF [Halanaerocella petrolearia]
MKLEKDNKIPLYYQLEKLIREKVRRKEYKPGEKIPSERDLSKLFNLSRMTVRKALENLVNEGVLERRERQGTFVSENSVKDFPGLIGVKEHIRSQGKKPSYKIINKELIKPKQKIIDRLNLNAEEKVILIERVILADEKAVGFEQSYIPYALCLQILESNMSKKSIYNMLRQNNHKPTKATDETEAILATDKLVQLLSTDQSQPILKNIRITFSKDRPIVYSFNYYLGDEVTMIRTSFNQKRF